MIDDTYKQAACFFKLFNEKMSGGVSADIFELIRAYASIPLLPRLKKLNTVLKYKTFMQGFARKTMQIVILLTISNKTGK